MQVYDEGCSVQLMDHIIDLTGQVNQRVEELQRTAAWSDKLARLDKLPCSQRRAAIPAISILRMLQDTSATNPGQQPVSLSPSEKSDCTSSPVCSSDPTQVSILLASRKIPLATTTRAGAAAGVLGLDGGPGKFSGSTGVLGSSTSASAVTGGCASLTSVLNTRTTKARGYPRTASFSQELPGPVSGPFSLSFYSPPAAAAAPPPPPPPPVARDDSSSLASRSHSSFPSSLPPLPPLLTATSTNRFLQQTALPAPKSTRSSSSALPLASRQAKTKTAQIHQKPPILAARLEPSTADLGIAVKSDSASDTDSSQLYLSPPAASLSHDKPEPASLLHWSHPSADSMPSATFPSSCEPQTDSFLRVSLGGTTARNSHSSHSIRGNGKPSSHRINGRSRSTSAQSFYSTRSSDPLQRRQPGPMYNPFARGPRQRRAEGLSDAAACSRTGAGAGMCPSSTRARPSHGRMRRSTYSAGRQVPVSGSNPPPPLTGEEFEALPVAIQRKYFSTLERLRFAQNTAGGQAKGIYHDDDANTAQNTQRRKTRQDRIVSDGITNRLRRKRSLRESPSIVGASVADPLFYVNLPEKIRKREFTREEQVLLAGQLRTSVILDAADEAIFKKIGRRSSTSHRWIAPDITLDTPPTASFHQSMESPACSSDPRRSRRDALGLQLGPPSSSIPPKGASEVPESFYDSFRWLEEDDDLDLRFFLDDYHSNLRDQLPSSNKERLPSFRRRMSISKMPFNRPPATATGSGGGSSSGVGGGLASRRPATKDDVPMRLPLSLSLSKSQSPTSSSANGGSVPFPSFGGGGVSSASAVPTSPTTQVRRKSRTLSLITPKNHATQLSVSTIDPSAAHYQDPEARLKLRVYLASPQKFDEAIEFGFPSTDVLATGGSTAVGTASAVAPSAAAAAAKRPRNARKSTSEGSNTLRTFLMADDDDEAESDQASVPDPESPKTPQLIPEAATGAASGVSGVTGKAPFRPYRLSTEPALGHRPSDSYAQVPASSREMTLRMTLTRLDLRAGEEAIYGSGHQPRPSYSRKSSSTQNQNYGLRPGGGDELLSGPTTPKMSMATGMSTPMVVSPGPAPYMVGRDGSRPKESIENVFAGIDHWEAVDQDRGVMKRLWNRVRRS